MVISLEIFLQLFWKLIGQFFFVPMWLFWKFQLLCNCHWNHFGNLILKFFKQLLWWFQEKFLKSFIWAFLSNLLRHIVWDFFWKTLCAFFFGNFHENFFRHSIVVIFSNYFRIFLANSFGHVLKMSKIPFVNWFGFHFEMISAVLVVLVILLKFLREFLL